MERGEAGLSVMYAVSGKTIEKTSVMARFGLRGFMIPLFIQRPIGDETTGPGFAGVERPADTVMNATISSVLTK